MSTIVFLDGSAPRRWGPWIPEVELSHGPQIRKMVRLYLIESSFKFSVGDSYFDLRYMILLGWFCWFPSLCLFGKIVINFTMSPVFGYLFTCNMQIHYQKTCKFMKEILIIWTTCHCPRLFYFSFLPFDLLASN